MQIIKLYRYEREGGGVSVSPVKPNVEYTEMVRMVADEGKVLTRDGKTFAFCVDAHTTDGWYEAAEDGALSAEGI